MAENIVFIVDEKIESEERKFNFIDFGIHENVMLTEVRIDKSPKEQKDYLYLYIQPLTILVSTYHGLYLSFLYNLQFYTLHYPKPLCTNIQTFSFFLVY